MINTEDYLEIDEALTKDAQRIGRGRPQELPQPDEMPRSDDPLGNQVGGDHYMNMEIQPIEFSMYNNLNACQHTAIKYIVRQKGNRLEDIDKAIHTLEIYKQFIQAGISL